MQISKLLELTQETIWSPPFLLGLALCALYFSWRLNWIQIRYLNYALKLVISPPKESMTLDQKKDGQLTHFQSLMTSLAGAIGTGNITGVATAITAGGLGALFWMWVIALLGMALKYAEALLALKHQVQNENGQVCGGPMYVLTNALNMKRTGQAFAFFGLIGCLGTGNTVQSHAIADALQSIAMVPPLTTGLILAAITGLIMIGGATAIGLIAQFFVPIMGLLYLGFGLFIIMLNFDKIPGVLTSIIELGFTGKSASAGLMGSGIAATIQAGFSRGIFSSESGMGTGAIACAAVKTDHPVELAMISMTSAFLSSVIVCSVTGLVIGISQLAGQLDPVTSQLFDGTRLAFSAFSQTTSLGGYVVSIGLVLFAYSTILGWAFVGETFAQFLGGSKIIPIFRIIYVGALIIGTTIEINLAWALADIGNGLMIFPNLYSLILLRHSIYSETKDYIAQSKYR